MNLLNKQNSSVDTTVSSSTTSTKTKMTKEEKKALFKKPIMWLFLASCGWLLLGILLGIFYDFFFLFGGSATFNPETGELVGQYPVFNEKIYVADPHIFTTQLSVLHTHTLILGFVMNLVFMGLEKMFEISKRRKWFISSFAVYNIGLFLVIMFMMIRGIDWVLNIQYVKVALTDVTGKTYYKFELVNTEPYKTIPNFVTAIPHITMGTGFVLMIHEISKGVVRYAKAKKENSDNTNK